MSRTGAFFYQVFSLSRQNDERSQEGNTMLELSRRRIQSCCSLWQIVHYNVLGAMIFERRRITSSITASWNCPASDSRYQCGIRGPQDVILCLCFINHFLLTQISAPSCEQTSSTSPSSWHWNPAPPAAGRHSYQHIYLSFQRADCSCCQLRLVSPPVKRNKSQTLKTLSSLKRGRRLEQVL